MDCITTIQKAIQYMEENLLENISYKDVARQVYMSCYHFHRTFSMITGITANEYIRNRRLSMAGQEIIMSDSKVIDLAYKYGYESPESFTKAFSRFHGISPSVARRSGMQLKLYNRLILKLIMEGGTIMDYKIVEREPFKLIAKIGQFRNEIVNDADNHDIPDFWDRSGKAGVFDELRKYAISNEIYGACAPVSKESEYFEYGIGMLYDGSAVPDGYRVWEVKPTMWAVFSCYGDNGDCIGEMWNRIFKEFLPASDYVMLDDLDFELYPAQSDEKLFCEIWIPVEKRY